MLGTTTLSDVMTNISTVTAGLSSLWVIGAVAIGVFLGLVILGAVVDFFAKRGENDSDYNS